MLSRLQAAPRQIPQARAALLGAMTANMRPRIVIVVDPDIDVPRNATGPVQVALMVKRGLRLPPAAGAALPGGTLDPSVDRSPPLDR